MADLVLTDANFEEEVIRSDLPVLVDFFATWCGPCKMMAPVLDELAKEYKGKLKVGKLDIDENQTTSQNFGIMSIPTIMLFKGGKTVSSLVGFRPKEALIAEIKKVIG
jgi:thioredoxin 1